MGDLTDAGDLEGYDKTSQFIAHSLQLGEGRRHASQGVRAEPRRGELWRRRPRAQVRFVKGLLRRVVCERVEAAQEGALDTKMSRG